MRIALDLKTQNVAACGRRIPTVLDYKHPMGLSPNSANCAAAAEPKEGRRQHKEWRAKSSAEQPFGPQLPETALSTASYYYHSDSSSVAHYPSSSEATPAAVRGPLARVPGFAPLAAAASGAREPLASMPAFAPVLGAARLLVGTPVRGLAPLAAASGAREPLASMPAFAPLLAARLLVGTPVRGLAPLAAAGGAREPRASMPAFAPLLAARLLVGTQTPMRWLRLGAAALRVGAAAQATSR